MIAIVYTALFGPYDHPLPAPYNGILFTDQDIKVDGWHIEKVKPPHEDLRYASRYYFDQSCLVMPEAEYTVMHGANAQLKVHPAELATMLPPDINLACLPHWTRASVYDEAQACIRMGKDKKNTIEAQMDRYRKDGFPEDAQLSACILLVRRNTEQLREFENFWWNEVANGSCRDQLSFDYSRWKLDFPIMYLPGRLSDYLRVGRHKK